MHVLLAHGLWNQNRIAKYHQVKNSNSLFSVLLLQQSTRTLHTCDSKFTNGCRSFWPTRERCICCHPVSVPAFSPCSVQTHHWIFNSILILWNDSRLLLPFNSFGSMYNSITGWEIHQVTQWICLHQFRKTRHSVMKPWKKSCIIWNAPPAASMFSHKKKVL